MRIVVCVKQLPDLQGTRAFAENGLVDRAAATPILNELDEHAVEAAVRLVEAHGGEVLALSMGPAGVSKAVRQAMQIGASAGFAVTDDALRGTDATGTARVLAAALGRIGEQAPVDLVLTGMSATDAYGGIVPAMLAELLDLPQLTFAGSVEVDGDLVRVVREVDDRSETIEASLPALVSVTDQTPTARFPDMTAMMAARKAPLTTWTLADLGLDPAHLGQAGAGARVAGAVERPPRVQGEVVVDDGDGSGARALAAFLLERTAAGQVPA